MRILAFDTAAGHCSAAVVTPEGVLAEVIEAAQESHSRRLMEHIREVISRCGLTLSEIDGLAVTHGPGSFTGLRIALSTAKGLALAIGKPVVSVSTLRVLASQVADAGILISPMLDARKGEVYFTRCRFSGKKFIFETAESAGPPEAAAAGIREPCLFIGEGALRYAENIRRTLGERARFPGSRDHAVRASVVGFLGLERIRQNPGADPASLVPVYIRGADVRKPSLT